MCVTVSQWEASVRVTWSPGDQWEASVGCHHMRCDTLGSWWAPDQGPIPVFTLRLWDTGRPGQGTWRPLRSKNINNTNHFNLRLAKLRVGPKIFLYSSYHLVNIKTKIRSGVWRKEKWYGYWNCDFDTLITWSKDHLCLCSQDYLLKIFRLGIWFKMVAEHAEILINCQIFSGSPSLCLVPTLQWLTRTDSTELTPCKSNLDKNANRDIPSQVW